jgi:hypothetical protein
VVEAMGMAQLLGTGYVKITWNDGFTFECLETERVFERITIEER